MIHFISKWAWLLVPAVIYIGGGLASGALIWWIEKPIRDLERDD